MGKFVLHPTQTGFRFELLAPNGQSILHSEVYETRAACLKGIQSIRTNAPTAGVRNLTEEEPAVPNPRFELYRDKAGEYRFRLKAKNGRIIGISEGYSARAGCLNGIESVKENAAEAEIET